MSNGNSPNGSVLAQLGRRVQQLGLRARRRATVAAIDNLVHGMAAAGRLIPEYRPTRHEIDVVSDIAYQDDGQRAHLLDVYRPVGRPGPWPVVIYVHGGGFNILSKDTHWVMGVQLARRGYLTFNINYRLAPRHPFPAGLIDTANAYGWVLDNAERFGGDPRRLALAGESAGANLITALCIACCYERDEPWARAVWQLDRRPDALLPICGLHQVSDVERFGRDKALPTAVLDRLQSVREGYLGADAPEGALADPLLLLERGDSPIRPLPPFFVAAGTKDPVLDDTRRLQAALERLGVRCDAGYYEGEIHAFHALVWRARAKQCWQDIYGFLERELGS